MRGRHCPKTDVLETRRPVYQVSIADERSLTRERWNFAVTRVEEPPPSDAVVAETPIGLSPQDTRIVGATLSAVYADADDFLGEPEFTEIQTVQYHQGLNPEDSDLIPSPPFDFLKDQNSEEYYRPVTEQRSVRVPEWTYTVQDLTGGPAYSISYAESEIVNRQLDSGLSAASQTVVDDAISDEDPRRYGESAPPSNELLEVLERLEIAADLEPIEAYSDRVDFDHVAATYQDSTYTFSLVVNPQCEGLRGPDFTIVFLDSSQLYLTEKLPVSRYEP
ncbi:hypothetical protein ABNG03_04950 [Halorubrum sp. RMP-47]|uniref:Halobacterial output domain-containing protein n=1 Tax=Halorubrum miltondacostae TaxID=3076378 RepID=A0ABD5M6A8_9EURY